MTAPKLTNIRKLAPKDQEVKTTFESYVSHFEATTEGRKSKYKQIANDYYDLATHFYEFGWGPSFHFAPRYKGENLTRLCLRPTSRDWCETALVGLRWYRYGKITKPVLDR